MKRHPIRRLTVLRLQYLFWRAPINWYILLAAAAYLSSRWGSLRLLVRETRLPVNAPGLFSAGFSDSWVLLACAAGAVALLSAIPFLYPCRAQELLRMGQARYTAARLCHIMLIALVYTCFLFLCTWLLSGASMRAVHRWGKMLNTIAVGNMPLTLDIRLRIPLALTQNYTPIAAAGLAALLFFAVATGIGWLMYALSVLAGRKWALTAGVASIVFDISIEEIGLGYRMYRYSPWSWVRLDLLLSDSNPYVLGHDATLIAVFFMAAAGFALAMLAGTSRRALNSTPDAA